MLTDKEINRRVSSYLWDMGFREEWFTRNMMSLNPHLNFAGDLNLAWRLLDVINFNPADMDSSDLSKWFWWKPDKLAREICELFIQERFDAALQAVREGREDG